VRLRTNIENFDFTKDGDMADKTVYTRTDIHMPLGICLVNPACDLKILLEIGPKLTTRLCPFVDYWHGAGPLEIIR
jgi:hypothetical protein